VVLARGGLDSVLTQPLKIQGDIERGIKRVGRKSLLAFSGCYQSFTRAYVLQDVFSDPQGGGVADVHLFFGHKIMTISEINRHHVYAFDAQCRVCVGSLAGSADFSFSVGRDVLRYRGTSLVRTPPPPLGPPYVPRHSPSVGS